VNWIKLAKNNRSGLQSSASVDEHYNYHAILTVAINCSQHDETNGEICLYVLQSVQQCYVLSVV
jgi:hypothetical protein